MSSYQVEAQDINFPVCQMTVNDIARYGRLIGIKIYYETTSRYAKLKAVHHK